MKRKYHVQMNIISKIMNVFYVQKRLENYVKNV